MARAGQILRLFPSPWMLAVALIPAAIVGYFLWDELEPVPRRVVTINWPRWIESVRSRKELTFSPDGKSLVFETEEWTRDDPGCMRTTLHLIDLATGIDRVLFEDKREWAARPVEGIVFAPDDERLAGAHGANVIIWDRHTGAELKRFAVEPRGERLLAFIPADDLVTSDLIVLNTGKTWKGLDRDFDLAHDEQKPQLPGGKVIVAMRNTPFVKMHATLNWIYGDGADPAPIKGANCLDKQGKLMAFLRGDGIFGLSPNERTFVAMRHDDDLFRIEIFDCPLRPWLRILGVPAILFVSLLLILQFSGWFRKQ